MTIIEEELTAVLKEFGASQEIVGSGCWTLAECEGPTYPLIVAQSAGRSNVPSYERTTALIEDWQPEYLLMVGIGGAITRVRDGGVLEGPALGDVLCIEYVHYGEYVKRSEGRARTRYTPIAHPSTSVLSAHVNPLRRSDWGLDLPVERPDGQAVPPAARLGEVVALEFLAGDANAAEQREVFARYDHALGVDMESYGVARAMHAAHSSVHYGPLWIGFRGISDRSAATQEAQAVIGTANNQEREVWKAYAACTSARFARKVVERLIGNPRQPREADTGAPGWST